MKTTEKDVLHIVAIVRALHDAQRFLGELSSEEFAENDEKQNAVAMAIARAGEHVKKLSKEFRESESGVPWRGVSGMRDWIAHDYKFDSVYNAFLVPSSSDTFSKIARVSFSEVMGWYEAPFNNYIDMWALPAHKVFDSYLWDKKISDAEIKEILRSENQTNYASVVEHYMQKHLDDSPIIQKLHQNRLLSEEEFNKLECIFTHDLGSKDDYEHAYGSTPFGLQVRKFVKIDRKFVEQEFSHFFESNELSELQIDCVHEIEDYIVENGYMELSALHQSPFEGSKSFSRLFNEQLRADLLFVIDEITENAMEP